MEQLLVSALICLFCFGFAGGIVWTYPNWKGQVIAALSLWFFLFLGIVLLVGRYSSEGISGLLVPIWLLAGWTVSGGFAMMIATIRRKLA